MLSSDVTDPKELEEMFEHAQVLIQEDDFRERWVRPFSEHHRFLLYSLLLCCRGYMVTFSQEVKEEMEEVQRADRKRREAHGQVRNSLEAHKSG